MRGSCRRSRLRGRELQDSPPPAAARPPPPQAGEAQRRRHAASDPAEQEREAPTPTPSKPLKHNTSPPAVAYRKPWKHADFSTPSTPPPYFLSRLPAWEGAGPAPLLAGSAVEREARLSRAVGRRGLVTPAVRGAVCASRPARGGLARTQLVQARLWSVPHRGRRWSPEGTKMSALRKPIKMNGRAGRLEDLPKRLFHSSGQVPAPRRPPASRKRGRHGAWASCRVFDN